MIIEQNPTLYESVAETSISCAYCFLVHLMRESGWKPMVLGQYEIDSDCVLQSSGRTSYAGHGSAWCRYGAGGFGGEALLAKAVSDCGLIPGYAAPGGR